MNMALQSDGKVLISGQFTTYNGTARSYFTRINSDGSLDTSFNPLPAAGVNAVTVPIVVQSDGKIMIGGAFTAYNGTTRNYLARINSDGTLDTTFSPAVAGGWVYSIAVQ